ncbi:MAG: anti-sigma factor family protein [Candidatus Krumholzibacteriia bacterium]
MVCNRFQSEGMRLLDGEITLEEKQAYEAHVKKCDDCTAELRDIGRIVEFSSEIELKMPDEEYWTAYWADIYRRLERGTGFMLLIIGLLGITAFGLYKAMTSPGLLTFKGLSIAVLLAGLVVIFLSVLRERYHESKSDPYKGVKQ